MKIYGIGGLGADKRVFSKLKFDHDFIFLPWLNPNKNESLAGYAKRFSCQIDQSDTFVLVGVSFGGILSLELNKYTSPSKTILISSTDTRRDIPLFYRLLFKIGLHRFITINTNPPLAIMKWLFGVKEYENIQLLKSIINDTSPVFLRWALQKLSKWDENYHVTELFRIHGTDDRIIKPSKDKLSMLIERGGHFIIVENARQVNQAIQEIIRH